MSVYEVKIVPEAGSYPWWGQLNVDGKCVNRKPCATLWGAEWWARRTLKALRKLDKLNEEFRGKSS